MYIIIVIHSPFLSLIGDNLDMYNVTVMYTMLITFAHTHANSCTIHIHVHVYLYIDTVYTLYLYRYVPKWLCLSLGLHVGLLEQAMGWLSLRCGTGSS
jgi:hypothetical protein